MMDHSLLLLYNWGEVCVALTGGPLIGKLVLPSSKQCKPNAEEYSKLSNAFGVSLRDEKDTDSVLIGNSPATPTQNCCRRSPAGAHRKA